MLIGGRQYHNIDEAFDAVLNLPSCFSKKQKFDMGIELDTPMGAAIQLARAKQLCEEVKDMENTGVPDINIKLSELFEQIGFERPPIDGDIVMVTPKAPHEDKMARQEMLEQAVEYYQQASQEFKKAGNIKASAFVMASIGETYQNMGMFNEAAPFLDESIRVFESQENYSPVFLAVPYGFKYRNLNESLKVKYATGETQEAKAIEKELARIREQTQQLIIRYKDEPINGKAHCVGQDEIGFSDKEPMGTLKVEDCIAVTLRDPKTNMTALFHYGIGLDSSSIDRAFERMPKDTMLEAELLGARYVGFAHEPKFREMAEHNYREVLSHLITKNVNITAADVGDVEQPSVMTIYPETGEKVEEMPHPGLIHAQLSFGAGAIGSDLKQLRILFDLTESDEYAPLFLTEAIVEKMNEYSSMGITGMYDYMFEESPLPQQQIPQSIKFSLMVMEEHERVVGEMMEFVHRRVTNLNEQVDITVSPKSIAAAERAIRKCSIHIGENADIANKPLADYILGNLFVPIGDGMYDSNTGDLKDVVFPEQPYEAVEAHYADDTPEIGVRVSVSEQQVLEV